MKRLHCCRGTRGHAKLWRQRRRHRWSALVSGILQQQPSHQDIEAPKPPNPAQRSSSSAAMRIMARPFLMSARPASMLRFTTRSSIPAMSPTIGRYLLLVLA
ncbi:hypothetical protein BDA96_06G187900 [Sorghum bicolor]|uniref:Uncharacterized protein n=1 Tax=Sorghum bicolor TaxID=4558 RepID=A0A921QSE0_SORBI|nr:hypothetical protein BDA96_06G187900 [Sorghum bicolor]